MNEDPPNSRSFRITVITVVALTIVYPLSLAPVQWAQRRGFIDGSEWRELRLYTPIAVIADHSPNFVKKTINRYAWLFTPYRTHGGVI